MSDRQAVPPEQKDLWFDPQRIPKTPAARAVVADVLHQVQSYEDHRKVRQRRRKDRDQQTFEATVSAVVCDLIYKHLLDPGRPLVVTRSNRKLGRRSRYRALTYHKAFPAILDALSSPEMGFVEQTLGSQQESGYAAYFGDSNGQRAKRKATTMRPGKRLTRRIIEHQLTWEDFGISIQQESIILKRTKEDLWDEGRKIEYTDTPTTCRYREQMAVINGWLLEADIEFDEVLGDVKQAVDVQDRFLRRVFTLERFDCGGRLFGSFWQRLSKRQRLDGMRIGGEDVISLDYSQMMPRILYGLAGHEPPAADAYTIPGFERDRSGVKQVFNAMVFADKPLTRMPQGVRKSFAVPARQRNAEDEKYNASIESVRVRDVVNGIMEAHPLIKDQFFRCLGHEAQFIESQILVDLLLQLRDAGVVALPVHDAVVVPRSSQALVERMMLDVFQSHTGVEGRVTEER